MITYFSNISNIFSTLTKNCFVALLTKHVMGALIQTCTAFGFTVNVVLVSGNMALRDKKKCFYIFGLKCCIHPLVPC